MGFLANIWTKITLIKFHKIIKHLALVQNVIPEHTVNYIELVI